MMHLRLLILFITTLLIIGCSTGTDIDEVDFGAEYNVVVTDEFPNLTDSELQVEVSYSGCDPNHEFSLNFRQTNVSEYDVWLTKVTPDQDCQAFFQELVIQPMPEEIRTGRVVFFGPNERIVLREG